MARGLDHIVHAVRDLDAAAALYRDLGFTVGARNRHPWGTHNHIVQFPGCFIELLTLAEPDKLGGDGFSRFVRRLSPAISSSAREGLSLLILESRDAAADDAAFRAAGIAASEVMRFEREGKRPDGSPSSSAFSLAFAEDSAAPDIHFATCQQHYPEKFLEPGLPETRQQRHRHCWRRRRRRGAAAAPRFLRSLRRRAGRAASTAGFALATPRGTIEVLDARRLHRPLSAWRRRTLRAARGWRRCALPSPMPSLLQARARAGRHCRPLRRQCRR